MVPLSRARRRSSSSTMAPRAVLMRKAEGFMMASVRSLMRWRVSGVRGQCSETKSLCARTSSSVVSVERLWSKTVMPRQRAISPTRVPMAPLPPTRPSTLPRSSKKCIGGSLKKWLASPLLLRRADCCADSEVLRSRRKVTTSCATASVEYAAALQTAMPRSRAALTSTLLNPVPASQMSLTDRGSARTHARSTLSSFVMSTEAPRAL
mmetsp:Transcript_29613/g.90606  ORF Transcript_29613/g.90606 Transcript_29613/m.90606 type:complete len:208 (-) Transcript_29613:10-633(-)